MIEVDQSQTYFCVLPQSMSFALIPSSTELNLRELKLTQFRRYRGLKEPVNSEPRRLYHDFFERLQLL